MGRKSRREIEGEFSRQQYHRILELKSDPQFQSICRDLSKTNKKIARIEQDYKKIPSSTPHKAIYPDDPEYPIAMKRYELRQKLGSLEETKESLERVLVEEYGFTIPINPFEEEVTLKDFIKDDYTEEGYPKMKFPIFQDSIIRDRPFRKSRLIPDPQDSETSKLDFTDYLRPDRKTGKPRYIRYEIDLWNKRERIVAALIERLDFLEDLGIFKFKSRLRLSTDEERIRVRELRNQGMSEKEIARFLWPKEYDEEENIITEIEDQENKKEISRENYIRELLDQGEKFREAQKKARKKYPPKKLPVNSLIKKVSRLLSEIPK